MINPGIYIQTKSYYFFSKTIYINQNDIHFKYLSDEMQNVITNAKGGRKTLSKRNDILDKNKSIHFVLSKNQNILFRGNITISVTVPLVKQKKLIPIVITTNTGIYPTWSSNKGQEKFFNTINDIIQTR
jgi:hypothetical protein